MKLKFCTLILVTSSFGATALADDHETTSLNQCEQSITIFQDVSRIGRKDRLAANITRRHKEMNAEGWRFVDMEIYVENADIEGAFLSYSRTVSCASLKKN